MYERWEFRSRTSSPTSANHSASICPGKNAKGLCPEPKKALFWWMLNVDREILGCCAGAMFPDSSCSSYARALLHAPTCWDHVSVMCAAMWLTRTQTKSGKMIELVLSERAKRWGRSLLHWLMPFPHVLPHHSVSLQGNTSKSVRQRSWVVVSIILHMTSPCNARFDWLHRWLTTANQSLIHALWPMHRFFMYMWYDYHLSCVPCGPYGLHSYFSDSYMLVLGRCSGWKSNISQIMMIEILL